MIADRVYVRVMGSVCQGLETLGTDPECAPGHLATSLYILDLVVDAIGTDCIEDAEIVDLLRRLVIKCNNELPWLKVKTTYPTIGAWCQ